jgi:transposase InsO family protein
MKAATFLGLLEKLGIQSSFSWPRVSNDNPYSEAMFRTLKYRPDFPHKGFASLEEARQWAQQFVHWYNGIHLHKWDKFCDARSVPHGRALSCIGMSTLNQTFFLRAKFRYITGLK